MSKRRQDGEIVWKRAYAGFGVQGSYAQILPGYEDWGCIYAPWPPDEPDEKLMMQGRVCRDPDCREWFTLLLLPGETRAEAIAALVNGDYIVPPRWIQMERLEKGKWFMGPWELRGGTDDPLIACHVNECELYDSKEAAATDEAAIMAAAEEVSARLQKKQEQAQRAA